MNPLTNVRNTQNLNKRELELGLVGSKASWHDDFKDSAWIFVGGLPYDLTEGDILAVFSQYGEIVNLNLVRDRQTGKSKGFGFICYEDQRSTILAVDNFNGIKLLSRTIRVNHVADYKMPKEHGDEDEVTLALRQQGCAPTTASAGRPDAHDWEDSEDDPQTAQSDKKKKRKKEKKAKKEKMKEDSVSQEQPSYKKSRHNIGMDDVKQEHSDKKPRHNIGPDGVKQERSDKKPRHNIRPDNVKQERETQKAYRSHTESDSQRQNYDNDSRRSDARDSDRSRDQDSRHYDGRDDRRYDSRNDRRYDGRDDKRYDGRDNKRYDGRDDKRYDGRDDKRYDGKR